MERVSADGVESWSAPSVSPPTRRRTTARKLGALLRLLGDEHPMLERLDLGPHVHWRGNASEPMHRWLRYREAYSPALIDKLELGRDILDPFCGCGSIPIGAAIRGRASMGVDLNPIATFSTQVKLTPLTSAQLRAVTTFADTLHLAARHQRRARVPDLSIATKVFEPDILDVILRVRAGIDANFGADSAAKHFVQLALISSLESVGSYFKEGNGIKYRNKKRERGRYLNRPNGVWQAARFGKDQRKFAVETIRQRLNVMIQDTSLWGSGSWSRQRIVQGSALNLRSIAGSRRFDSIIFSPPYANRFDYFESFKVELWFGEFVKSYQDLAALRKASLRSHLGADYARPTTHWEPVEQFIALMDKSASSWRMGVPDLMRGYFHDMREILAHCRQLLRTNGKCYVVVGNSAFAGVIVPTDVLTAKLGGEVGFKRARIMKTRHLTVAPQQRNLLDGLSSYMRESVIELE